MFGVSRDLGRAVRNSLGMNAMKRVRTIAALSGAVTVSLFCLNVTPTFAENQRKERETTNQNQPASRSEGRGMFGSGAQDTKQEIHQTAREAANVFRKFSAGKQITDTQLQKAQCVAVFPGLTDVALVVGGRHGDGVMACRTESGWSQVAPLDLTSASVGAQIGARRADLVLLVNSENARKRIEDGVITLGADASVSASTSETSRSAGVGAQTGSTDIVAYSEDRGLFAGAALNGSILKIDSDEIRALHGRQVSNRELLTSKADPSTAVGSEFINALNTGIAATGQNRPM